MYFISLSVFTFLDVFFKIFIQISNKIKFFFDDISKTMADRQTRLPELESTSKNASDSI